MVCLITSSSSGWQQAVESSAVSCSFKGMVVLHRTRGNPEQSTLVRCLNSDKKWSPTVCVLTQLTWTEQTHNFHSRFS